MNMQNWMFVPIFFNPIIRSRRTHACDKKNQIFYRYIYILLIEFGGFSQIIFLSGRYITFRFYGNYNNIYKTIDLMIWIFELVILFLLCKKKAFNRSIKKYNGSIARVLFDSISVKLFIGSSRFYIVIYFSLLIWKLLKLAWVSLTEKNMTESIDCSR